MKESPKRYTNPFLSDEENAKVNLWNNQELETPIIKDDFAPNLEDVPSESLKKAKELYIDKNVTEYEESDSHVVKDICVDDGLTNGEKIECEKDHHKLPCDPINLNGNKHDDMIKDCEEKLDTKPDLLNNSSKEQLDSNSDSTNNSSNNDVAQQLSEVQTLESELESKSNEIKMEENITPNIENVKPENIIEPRETENEECVEKVWLDTQIAPNHHDDVAENQLQRGGGESSFALVGPVSGLITYSGPVVASGSISHRSDGSNTSVRSFAFPILQSEWNSSPVRMAKVDQRQLRKHRGWRQALMCCRF